MKKIYLAIMLLVLLSLPVGAQVSREDPALHFSYALAHAERTSAGVFDSNGSLIRTLWSNRPQVAGTYSEMWDGKDDSGVMIATHELWKIKVLHSNVDYHWDGVIGNTEDAWTSSTNIWDGLGYIPTQLRFAFANGTLWAATGYSEGLSNLLRLNPRTPNAPKSANAKYFSQNVNFADIDTDGAYLYIANQAVWSGKNFVTKMDASDGSPAAFTLGHVISSTFSWKGVSMNGIALYPKGGATPSAIAVQKTGSILAVAYTSNDKIEFFDKTTGATYGQTLSVSKPKSIGFTSKGLWILSDSTVYFVPDPGRSNKLLRPLNGLSNPVYLTTNKTNDHVFVLDGGASQQVKEFNVLHHLSRTYGDLGGYTDRNPTITNSRLLLDNIATKGVPTPTGSWLKVSPNNELWLCDGGTAGRILHISAENTYIDQIQFQQETYTIGIGQSLPTRLFRGAIEYEINYSSPLLPGDPDPARGGNGSWKMVRNWSVGAEGANGSSPASYQPLVGGGIVNAEILSNGHIYAHIVDAVTHRYDEVELPLSGTTPLRFISTLNINQGDYPLQTDGSIMKEITSGKSPNLVITLQKKKLLGFDGNNNPVRDNYREVATVNYNPASEPRFSSGWGTSEPLQKTQSGVYPIFTTTPYALGAPHLGGIISGRSSYLWKTMKEASIKVPDLAGSFPVGSGYGGHNGIATSVVGNNVFASYDGQYASWGNQHYHYWEDGLMIGQFGQPKFGVAGLPRPAGSAGNIASTRFVMFDGTIYMYMAVEAGYTPVQRWKISNLSSIAEYIGNGKLGESIKLTEGIP